MANYGDVALNLSPTWTRAKEQNKRYALQIVGHENGVADVFLSEEPDKRHQFAWADPRYRDDIDLLRNEGYRIVLKSDGWEKNENLWEWNATDHIQFMSQELYARPSELYFAAEAEKTKERMRDTSDAKASEIAREAGIELDDDERPRKKRRAGA